MPLSIYFDFLFLPFIYELCFVLSGKQKLIIVIKTSIRNNAAKKITKNPRKFSSR